MQSFLKEKGGILLLGIAGSAAFAGGMFRIASGYPREGILLIINCFLMFCLSHYIQLYSDTEKQLLRINRQLSYMIRENVRSQRHNRQDTDGDIDSENAQELLQRARERLQQWNTTYTRIGIEDGWIMPTAGDTQYMNLSLSQTQDVPEKKPEEKNLEKEKPVKRPNVLRILFGGKHV